MATDGLRRWGDSMGVCVCVGRFLSLVIFRSKGVILNISSASGMYPVPLLTVYSATKVRAFMTVAHQTVHVC